MSCNGCRALRKGCSDGCILRQGLQDIPTPQAQSHATVFLARFFGRSDLVALIAGVPQHNRSSLFQSLLYEACGRTVNPVSGAVGLLWSGNWHLCQAAVDTVLAGGTLSPIPSAFVIAPPQASDDACGVSSGPRFSSKIRGGREGTRKWSPRKDQNMTTASSGNTGGDDRVKLLNLFV